MIFIYIHLHSKVDKQLINARKGVDLNMRYVSEAKDYLQVFHFCKIIEKSKITLIGNSLEW